MSYAWFRETHSIGGGQPRGYHYHLFGDFYAAMILRENCGTTGPFELRMYKIGEFVSSAADFRYRCIFNTKKEARTKAERLLAALEGDR